MVKDIWPGRGGSFPRYLTDVGGTLFFSAHDGTHGHELWRSDGTEAGTVMVRTSGRGGRVRSPPPHRRRGHPVLHGRRRHARARAVEDATGPSRDRHGEGHLAGIEDGSVPDTLTDVGGTLYFAADDGTHGRELWKIRRDRGRDRDGEGHLAGSAGPSPDYLTDVGGTLYFTANDGTHGRELWKIRRDRGRDRHGEGHLAGRGGSSPDPHRRRGDVVLRGQRGTHGWSCGSPTGPRPGP